MLPPARTASRRAALRRLAVAIGFILPATPCLAQRAMIGPPAPNRSADNALHVMAYSDLGVSTKASADGMGLFAGMGDGSVNLATPTELVDGPSGSLFDQSAGLGWRKGHVSAMVGYMKPSSIKSATYFRPDGYTPPAYKNVARVGVGWSLHF